MIYYLTRDSYPGGALAKSVTVWTEKPKRVRVGSGHTWIGCDGILRGYCDSYFLSDCYDEFGVVPDSDVMMIRVVRSCAS